MLLKKGVARSVQHPFVIRHTLYDGLLHMQQPLYQQATVSAGKILFSGAPMLPEIMRRIPPFSEAHSVPH